MECDLLEALKQRILKDGSFRADGILRVDSFLNHQIDVKLLNEIGKEFYSLFKDSNINKILTIEASGIGIACIAAQYFNVPVVFAKKAVSKNIDGVLYQAPVFSFTYDRECIITVSKNYLSEFDNILIIDDFLAKGNAIIGLIDLIKQSGAKLCGAGIVIEKGFQGGGDMLRDMGIRIESLAIIDNMDEHSICFR